jgi:predicted metal-dependent peptidase
MSTTNPAFTAVKTALLLHVPFFASLLLDIMDVRIGTFDHVFPPGMPPTMATDGKTIYIDEKFMNTLSVPEAVFGVCHEIGHAMWDHMQRGKTYLDTGFDGKEFHPMLFNVAADYVINDMLVKSGVGAMKKFDHDDPQGRYKKGDNEWLLDPKYTCEMAVEEVYRDLLKDAKKNKGKGTPGQGQDIHIFETGKVSSAEMKRAIQTAVDTAKACGKLPGALKRYADEFLESKVSWQEMLRTTVVTATTRDTTTWARAHRRRLAQQRMYLPRAAAFGCDLIMVFVDTSGSIGPKELNVFFSELADIIRTCHPETVVVLGVDSAVASVEELTGDVDITQNPPEVGGGGGTDFRPAFKWVEADGRIPDAAVYFTDMMGPFPDKDPGYPVIWCSTSENAEGPFGKTIYVDAS